MDKVLAVLTEQSLSEHQGVGQLIAALRERFGQPQQMEAARDQLGKIWQKPSWTWGSIITDLQDCLLQIYTSIVTEQLALHASMRQHFCLTFLVFQTAAVVKRDQKSYVFRVETQPAQQQQVLAGRAMGPLQLMVCNCCAQRGHNEDTTRTQCLLSGSSK